MSTDLSPPAVTAETVTAWQAHLDEVAARLGPFFARSETRARAMAYVEGLLGAVPRKNGWQLSEANGEATPDGIHYLLRRARWSPDAVREALCAYVAAHLGDPQGILIVDETGFLKKGVHSAGVARQYAGTAGRIENCQVGVFAAYVGPRGHALVDRELYLSKEWTRDPARLQAVGLAPDTPLTTKPELARRMLVRILDAGLPAAWATGDSVYGHAADLRQALEERGVAYVLAVPSHERVWWGWQQAAVAEIHAALAEEDWQRRSAGAGSKGPRGYEWQWVRTGLVSGPVADEAPQAPREHSLLFRRSCTDPDDWTAYRVHAPRDTDLDTVVQVAGARWCIERAFEDAKQEAGLDEYEVRSATGWYRHVTLALWALALLAAIRRLLWAARLRIVPALGHLLAWLAWKRRHAWVAQCCHYRRRAALAG